MCFILSFWYAFSAVTDFFSQGKITKVIAELEKNSFHEGHILVWTKGIIEVVFDVVGNSRVWDCCTHMKALFLTVVLTAALFIAALKYWHIWSTEMSEFCSRDRNQNENSVGMGFWGHRAHCAKKRGTARESVCFPKACLCFSVGNWKY